MFKRETMRGFRVLARLELINLFGLNEYRYTKDAKKKRMKRGLFIAAVFLVLVLLVYAGVTAYAFADFGLAEKIPMLFFMVAFVLQLALGAIKAKSLIYRDKDLDLLSALPVKGVHVVAARLLRLYLEGLVLTAILFLPGMIICGIYTDAGVLFFLNMIPGLFILPILPAAVSAWFGILFAKIIAGMKHKVLAEVMLVLFVVIGIFLLSSFSSTGKLSYDSTDSSAVTEESMNAEASSATDSSVISGDEEKLSEDGTEKQSGRLSKAERKRKRKAEEEKLKKEMEEAAKSVVRNIETGMPPVRAMGDAFLKPDPARLLIYLVLSLFVMGLTILMIGSNFFKLSAGLRTVSYHRDYTLGALREQTVMTALMKKEAARYFSSGIYVTNTIIGPILAVAIAVAFWFIDPADFVSTRGLPVTVTITAGLPYFLTGFFGMMSISSSSISMEGKSWWIPRSLPLGTKEILGAKLLFNLIAVAPVYGLMEILLLFTVRVSFMERLWLLIIPAVGIPFSILFGLFLNLKFPKMQWENATEVVKQSAASGLSILGGFILLLPGLGVIFLSPFFRNVMNLFVMFVIAGISWLLYRKIMHTDLDNIS